MTKQRFGLSTVYLPHPPEILNYKKKKVTNIIIREMEYFTWLENKEHYWQWDIKFTYFHSCQCCASSVNTVGDKNDFSRSDD